MQKINCTAIYPQTFKVLIVLYQSDGLLEAVEQVLKNFQSISFEVIDKISFEDRFLTNHELHQCVVHLISRSEILLAAQKASSHNHIYHNCPNLFLSNDGSLTYTMVQSLEGLDVGILQYIPGVFEDFIRRIVYREYDDQEIDKSNLRGVVFKNKNITGSKEIFRDPHLQKQFEADGMVKIPFLLDKEVEELYSIFNSINHQVEKGFYTTTWSKDIKVRLEVNKVLSLFFQPRIDSILKDYHFSYGNFFVKPPSENGDCMAHQDWSSVDESRFTSLTLWCALDDTNGQNGNLRYVPGSFKLDNLIRGRHMPIYFERYQTFIHRYLMKDIPMKKGELLIFNQRMIHGSKPNKSRKLRLACGGMATPLSAPLIHYVGAEREGKLILRALDASDDLFSKYDTFDTIEDGFTLKELEFQPKELSLRKLVKCWL